MVLRNIVHLIDYAGMKKFYENFYGFAGLSSDGFYCIGCEDFCHKIYVSFCNSYGDKEAKILTNMVLSIYDCFGRISYDDVEKRYVLKIHRC